MVNKLCKICGTEFDALGTAVTCSVECRIKNNRKSLKKYREANPEQRKKYYEANREKITEQNKQYREANREKVAEKDRRYREANREKRAEYREANREKIAERQKRYHEVNPQVSIKQRLKKKFGVNPPDSIVRATVELNQLKKELKNAEC